MPLTVHDELRFSFSLDELSDRLGERTKLVIVNSPNNPPAWSFRSTACAPRPSSFSKAPSWVLSDEVYRRIVYDGEVVSIASVPGMLEL